MLDRRGGLTEEGRVADSSHGHPGVLLTANTPWPRHSRENYMDTCAHSNSRQFHASRLKIAPCVLYTPWIIALDDSGIKKLTFIRSWRRRHDQLCERGKRAHQVNLVKAFVVELKRSGVGNVLVDLSYSTLFITNFGLIGSMDVGGLMCNLLYKHVFVSVGPL